MVVESKFLMLNGKNAFPGLNYEHFLIDVINASNYFASKKANFEQYCLDTGKQSNGENDVYSSMYQMDFKLLVSQSVMRARSKNIPELDYSMIGEGVIMSKSKPDSELIDVPAETILSDIKNVDIDELRNEKYGDCIKDLINNLKKPKNLFLYYPYEYYEKKYNIMTILEKEVTDIFSNVMEYRDELSLGCDTFICFKIDRYFVILEWENKAFVFKDKVNELLCTNYRNAKLYSVY